MQYPSSSLSAKPEKSCIMTTPRGEDGATVALHCTSQKPTCALYAERKTGLWKVPK